MSKKSLWFLLFILLSSLLLSVVASAGQFGRGRNNDYIIVYTDPDFGGRSQEFALRGDRSVYRVDHGDFRVVGNDTISSFRVPPGLRIRMCDNDGSDVGGGKCREYGPGDYRQIDRDLNDKVSYIEISHLPGGSPGDRYDDRDRYDERDRNNPSITVYEDPAFRGRAQTFYLRGNRSVYRVDRGDFRGVSNDAISSFRIPRGLLVRMCDDDGSDRGGGTCREYGPGDYRDIDRELNDRVSYIEIQRESGGGRPGGGGGGGNYRDPVVVFDRTNYNGRSQEFFARGRVTVYRNDRGDFHDIGNDTITSFRVPFGLRVRFCDNDGSERGSGVCREYGPGNYAVIDRALNNRVSYLEIIADRY